MYVHVQYNNLLLTESMILHITYMRYYCILIIR